MAFRIVLAIAAMLGLFAMKQNTDNANEAKQLAVTACDQTMKSDAVVARTVTAMTEINSESSTRSHFKRTCSLRTRLSKRAYAIQLSARAPCVIDAERFRHRDGDCRDVSRIAVDI